MRCVRALPIFQLMPAVGSRRSPVATLLLGGLPGEIERPHPFSSPHAGHPIHHHVAGPLSVDPDKFFGPLRGRPRMRENRAWSLALDFKALARTRGESRRCQISELRFYYNAFRFSGQAGRRHAQRVSRTTLFSHRRQQMT